MKKTVYEEPIFEIIPMNVSDVIVTSNEDSEGPGI